MAEIDPRMIFAAERTMLAWIRTGLSLMGFGFVVARFSLLLKELGMNTEQYNVRTPGFSLWIGIVLVLVGVSVNLYASLSYSQNIKRLKNGTMLEMSSWTMGRVVSFLLVGIGFFMISYLLLLR